jgi:hypothetical protein
MYSSLAAIVSINDCISSSFNGMGKPSTERSVRITRTRIFRSCACSCRWGERAGSKLKASPMAPSAALAVGQYKNLSSRPRPTAFQRSPFVIVHPRTRPSHDSTDNRRNMNSPRISQDAHRNIRSEAFELDLDGCVVQPKFTQYNSFQGGESRPDSSVGSGEQHKGRLGFQWTRRLRASSPDWGWVRDWLCPGDW